VTRSIIITDTVLQAEDGSPTRLTREFESISNDSARSRGDEEFESSQECPLSEVTLELTLDDGEVTAEVVDGTEPDDEALLEGHQMTFALDALLPEKDVAPGDEWDLSIEQLQTALLVDLESVLFPRPERTEGEEGGSGRGGRRGGMRAGRGGGGVARYISAGDWEVTATLLGDTEEYDGTECLVISIKGESTGELPESERAPGGGRRGGGNALFLGPSLRPENSFEMEIEARLFYDAKAERPVHFEFEGQLSTESRREMNRRETAMVISTAQEGTFTYSVDLTSADRGDE
jgi:hypothetical protein